MGALAFPALEAIAMRVLVALGLTTAGAAGVDMARKRKEEADDARTAPIARTQAQTRAKEKCKGCPPDEGALVTRNWNMSDASRAYQARVTGFAPYTEWNFGGVDFDGFRSSECLLQEAKARYDQFFDPETGEPKFFFGLAGAPKIINQGRFQSNVVAASAPARLNWYFMQPLSYRYFARHFATQARTIRTLLQP